MTYEYDKLEPIGLFFVFWFISILVIQLIGMLMHRITTLGHIVSSTSLKEIIKNWHGGDKDQGCNSILYQNPS